MIKINIVFEDDVEDVDIISVPDELVPDIEEIGQEFLDWIPSTNDNNYFSIIDGHKYFIAETDGFVQWLNTHYCQGMQKVCVVKKHTLLCNEYKTLEF